MVTRLAPGFPAAKGKRNRRVERFSLTTSCDHTETIPVAQAEAQLFLEPTLERNLLSVRQLVMQCLKVPNNILTMTLMGMPMLTL